MSLHSKFSSGFRCHLSEPWSPKYDRQAPPDLSSAPFCLPLLLLSFTHVLFQSYGSPSCSWDSIRPAQSPRLCPGCLLTVSRPQVSVQVKSIGQAFPSHPFRNGPCLPCPPPSFSYLTFTACVAHVTRVFAWPLVCLLPWDLCTRGRAGTWFCSQLVPCARKALGEHPPGE